MAQRTPDEDGRYRDYGADAPYLHTCAVCGKRYSDDNPFSDIRMTFGNDEVPLCSSECMAACRADFPRKVVATLATMARRARDPAVRAYARKELARIAAEDPDERLRIFAGSALERLKSENLP